MASERKDRVVENLAIAAAMGFLALLVAALSLLTDARTISGERDALADLSGRPVAAKPFAMSAPGFERFYRIEGSGHPLFGAVLPLRSKSGSTLVAALFTTDGELEAVRIVGAMASRNPYFGQDWSADFLGKGGANPYPASRSSSRNPAVVSGATESFLAAGETFGRASEAARRLAKELP